MPFVDVVRPTGVAFVKDKAIVYLYLNKRTVNQFDGYVGITPQDENSGKIAFHGELDLALANLFRLGERITLHWQSSNRHSQNLDITAEFDGRGYGVFKDAVADCVISVLEPIQQKYDQISTDKAYLQQVMDSGRERAGNVAHRTMLKVRKKLGIAPWKL